MNSARNVIPINKYEFIFQDEEKKIPRPQHVVIVGQLLSHVQLFVIPWTAVCQAFLSFTICQNLLKLIIESVMPSNYLILCRPLPALNLSQHQRLFQ